MPFKDVDTYFVDILLTYVSEIDVLRFAEAFPDHEEAVNSYWNCRQEINIDNVLKEDYENMLKVFERCKNLKKFTKRYYSEDENHHIVKLLNGLATHCLNLEILEIPGIILNDETSRMIRPLTTLTKLREINIFLNQCFDINTLFANNPQLESICIQGHLLEPEWWLHAIPRTITKFEYHDTGRDKFESSFFTAIESWQLQKLSLFKTQINTEQFRSLQSQRSLVSLNLYLDLDAQDHDLERLFQNNPRLEEVRLTSHSESLNGRCLRHLNDTLKKLELNVAPTIYYKRLLDCLKDCGCKIEELGLRHDLNDLLPLLPTIVPNLTILNISCGACSVPALSSLKCLKKLEVLKLRLLKAIHEEMLIEILQNCLSLKKLRLSGYGEMMKFEQKVFEALKALPQLKELHLVKLVFSGNSFELLSGLIKIKELTISECVGLTNANCLELIRGNTTLTSLRISWNNDISISIVTEVVEELKKQKYRTTTLAMHILIAANWTSFVLPTHPLLKLKTPYEAPL